MYFSQADFQRRLFDDIHLVHYVIPVVQAGAVAVRPRPQGLTLRFLYSLADIMDVIMYVIVGLQVF